jgi:uncharacterized Zn-finger protein
MLESLFQMEPTQQTPYMIPLSPFAKSPLSALASHSSAGTHRDQSEHHRSASCSPTSEDLKPIICPVKGCGKRFSRHYNLKSHMVSHSNERPVNFHSLIQ